MLQQGKAGQMMKVPTGLARYAELEEMRKRLSTCMLDNEIYRVEFLGHVQTRYQ